jgi:hypothetical protein
MKKRKIRFLIKDFKVGNPMGEYLVIGRIDGPGIESLF